MASVTTKAQGLQLGTETAAYLFDDWFDPIETGLREQVRSFIEELIRGELDTALARPRYARQVEPEGGAVPGLVGHRHGSRTRTLTGTFGAQQISVPRARIERPDGTTTEWKSRALRAYQRRTVAADALIASTYLAGTNTRRVRRALVALFGGAVGKDVVSRTWRKSLPRA
jgi:putative transposase